MLVGNVGLNSIAHDTDLQGFQVTKKVSNEVKEDLSVSNFGNETKAGSSVFQQSNEKADQLGQQATAEKMRDVEKTVESFVNKISYTKNATLEAIRQSTFDSNA